MVDEDTDDHVHRMFCARPARNCFFHYAASDLLILTCLPLSGLHDTEPRHLRYLEGVRKWKDQRKGSFLGWASNRPHRTKHCEQEVSGWMMVSPLEDDRLSVHRKLLTKALQYVT